MDQARSLSKNLNEELNHLADSLTRLATILPSSAPIQQPPMDTHLLQSISTNNNHIHDTAAHTTTARNVNCCPCPTMHRFPSPPQQPQSQGPFCFQPNPIRYPTAPSPCGSKPMGCGLSSGKADAPPPLCFPTPVVYTPEMETLFAADGIIYARKSGN